jgi:hypothetical protein
MFFERRMLMARKLTARERGRILVEISGACQQSLIVRSAP